MCFLFIGKGHKCPKNVQSTIFPVKEDFWEFPCGCVIFPNRKSMDWCVFLLHHRCAKEICLTETFTQIPFYEETSFLLSKDHLIAKTKNIHSAFSLDWKQLGCQQKYGLFKIHRYGGEILSRWKAVLMLPHFILFIVRFSFSLLLSYLFFFFFFVWWCVRPSFHPITI